jgi:ABC-2 type transport system permease protein
MRKILRKNKCLEWKQIFSLRKFNVVFEYEFLAFWQSKSQVLNNLIWLPILHPLLFGVGIASFAPKDVAIFGTTSYLSFIFPGIIGLRLFGNFSHVIYRLTIDRRYGLQGLKISSGVGVLGYILGNLMLPSIVILLQVVITMGVLMILATPIESLYNVALMLGVCIISAWFWGAFAMLVSFSFKSYIERDIFISAISLPLTLSSPAFYPLHHAPKYLQLISKFNPLTYNILALRDAFLYGKIEISFFILISLTLILLVWATFFVSKREFLSSKI